MNDMQLKEPYRKVLAALGSGQPKTSNELRMECGFVSPFECTGAISLLRRLEAIDQAGRGRYKITDKGKVMLQGAARLEVSPRMKPVAAPKREVRQYDEYSVLPP